ncbi:MAG: hypothetical protein ACYCX4_03485 [Bacillota bacterium]
MRITTRYRIKPKSHSLKKDRYRSLRTMYLGKEQKIIRWKYKRNKIPLYLLITLAVLLLWKAMSTPADAVLIRTFTSLDGQDFKAQSAAADQKKSEQMIRQVYTQPQLDKALQYLEELRIKKVKLRVVSVNYKDIHVLKKKRSMAQLAVNSRVVGGFYTARAPEMLVKRVDNQSKYEVELRKIDGRWLISRVVYIK